MQHRVKLPANILNAAVDAAEVANLEGVELDPGFVEAPRYGGQVCLQAASALVVARIVELVRVADKYGKVLDLLNVAEVDEAGDILSAGVVAAVPEAVSARVPAKLSVT